MNALVALVRNVAGLLVALAAAPFPAGSRPCLALLRAGYRIAHPSAQRHLTPDLRAVLDPDQSS